jgi:hypothetical protein
MIDHLAARRSLATAVDFALGADDAAELEQHLRECTACRSFDGSLRTDAATLRDLDFGPVPVAVRANVAIAAERRGGSGIRPWFALVAVGALLLAALGSGVLGAGGSTTGLGANGNPVHWATEVVDFQASDFWIEANGQRFTAAGADVAVASDPGNATYRTLEVTWHEHGVEMRLSLYFGGDATTWWVDEVRVYDGKPQGKWLEWSGTWFKAPIGAGWTGDVDLATAGGALHIGGLTLQTAISDGVNGPVVGAPVPEDLQPFAGAGSLRCSGILQRSPKDAEAALIALGYSLSWRLETTTGPATGFAQPMARAPEGVITREPVIGRDGELILFVSPVDDPKGVALPFPADCPPRPSTDPGVDPTAPTPAP